MAYELGATIRDLRKRQGMTQKELAGRLNVSEATICKYENNTSVPPFEILRSLAVIFNVSMDTLCGIVHRGSMSLHGLTPNQQALLEALSEAFRQKNLDGKKGQTDKQYALIGRIVTEMTK